MVKIFLTIAPTLLGAYLHAGEEAFNEKFKAAWWKKTESFINAKDDAELKKASINFLNKDFVEKNSDTNLLRHAVVQALLTTQNFKSEIIYKALDNLEAAQKELENLLLQISKNGKIEKDLFEKVNKQMDVLRGSTATSRDLFICQIALIIYFANLAAKNKTQPDISYVINKWPEFEKKAKKKGWNGSFDESDKNTVSDFVKKISYSSVDFLVIRLELNTWIINREKYKEMMKEYVVKFAQALSQLAQETV